MTPTDRANALLDIMGRLAALLDQEVVALRRQMPHELHDLHPRKQQLTKAYEEFARALRVDPEGLSSLDPELKARLAESTRTLREAGLKNEGVLRIRSQAHRRVVDMVVEVFRKEKENDTGYGLRRGRIVLAPQPKNAAPSLTLDTRL